MYVAYKLVVKTARHGYGNACSKNISYLDLR